MEMTDSQRGDLWILKVKGSLDAVTSNMMEKRIVEQMEQGRKAIAFDLSGLEYVSSAGVRVFLMVGKRMKTQGKWLCFCAPTPTVKQIFDLTGLSFRIDFAPSIEAAIQQFESAKP